MTPLSAYPKTSLKTAHADRAAWLQLNRDSRCCIATLARQRPPFRLPISPCHAFIASHGPLPAGDTLHPDYSTIDCTRPNVVKTYQLSPAGYANVGLKEMNTLIRCCLIPTLTLLLVSACESVNSNQQSTESIPRRLIPIVQKADAYARNVIRQFNKRELPHMQGIAPYDFIEYVRRVGDWDPDGFGDSFVQVRYEVRESHGLPSDIEGFSLFITKSTGEISYVGD